MQPEYSNLAKWLLSGDVSIQYQTKRDLLGYTKDKTDDLQLRIADEGWGKEFLLRRDIATGTWGNGMYSPKWISTHYTLLELKNLCLPPDNSDYIESAQMLLDTMWFNKGIIKKNRYQDLCVAAMIISICSYARIQSQKLFEITDYILEKQYEDGGWNCNWDRGDLHSSLHTTLSVLEALRDLKLNDYAYRLVEIEKAIPKAWEFILRKQLYRSVHTGEVIDKKMLMLSYPCRWKYDILRCLDYFQSVNKSYDDRMAEALNLIINKKKINNRWNVQQKYVGKVYFDMEITGGDSRWNTLRVLRVLKKYNYDLYVRLMNE